MASQRGRHITQIGDMEITEEHLEDRLRRRCGLACVRNWRKRKRAVALSNLINAELGEDGKYGGQSAARRSRSRIALLAKLALLCVGYLLEFVKRDDNILGLSIKLLS